jgi:uncharacterized protein (UPF0332 family)
MRSEPLLQKAERFIRSAQVLAVDGDLDSAASRLYYAMFFVAEALLAARGLSYSSHSAVISAYGQYFAKTKELDPGFHRSMLGAFSQRHVGDYSVESGLTQEDIAALASDAASFLAAARHWLAHAHQAG